MPTGYLLLCLSLVLRFLLSLLTLGSVHLSLLSLRIHVHIYSYLTLLYYPWYYLHHFTVISFLFLAFPYFPFLCLPFLSFPCFIHSFVTILISLTFDLTNFYFSLFHFPCPSVSSPFVALSTSFFLSLPFLACPNLSLSIFIF